MEKTLISLFVVGILAGCGSSSDSTSSTSVTTPNNLVSDEPEIQVDEISVYQSREWSTGVQLSGLSREGVNPSVRVLGDGTVFALWVESATENAPSAIFASVFNAELGEQELQRSEIQINQIDNGNETVVVNNRWNFTGEIEGFKPSPKLAVSNDGVGHAAWLQDNNSITSVYVSDYIPQSSSWSAPKSVESSSQSCSDIELFTISNGDSILLWKESSADGMALNGVVYYANSGSWGTVFNFANNIKDENIALWENNGKAVIAYLSSIDSENDALTVAELELNTGAVNHVVVDNDGLKGSLVGTNFKNSNVIVWAGMDELGYFSVKGAVNLSGVQWSAMPKVENLPYDVGHISIASIDDELNIVWQHKEQSSVGVFYDLNAVKYTDSDGVGDVETIFDSGAANPLLVNGGDGKLYLQWFTSHTKYSEYVLGDGWKPIVQPFCTDSHIINGSCFNGGTEHSLDVNGQYGVSAWLESVNGMRSVVISLSK